MIWAESKPLDASAVLGNKHSIMAAPCTSCCQNRSAASGAVDTAWSFWPKRIVRRSTMDENTVCHRQLSCTRKRSNRQDLAFTADLDLALRECRKIERRVTRSRTGSAGRSSRSTGTGLRLVHRGLQHQRSGRSKAADRRVDVSRLHDEGAAGVVNYDSVGLCQ